ncbi:hypothetical protein [Litoreibacter halocynthiae]|uniref:hypothetical protein n=1 Tax=Litoreibacter halocynthiae TaxID=1242689 RepID=UPI0010642BAA|nr:hypothetical protein [Litoreibacter halocynthiae]
MSNTTHSCQKCGQLLRVKDAYYEFRERVVETLSQAKITRQQARRFALKADKYTDISTLEFQSQFINPAFAELTRAAKSEKDTKTAIEIIKDVAKICVLIAGTAAAVGGGLITADDVWDRYQKDELFEPHPETPLDQVKDSFQEKTEEESNHSEQQEIPRSGESGTEV